MARGDNELDECCVCVHSGFKMFLPICWEISRHRERERGVRGRRIHRLLFFCGILRRAALLLRRSLL